MWARFYQYVFGNLYWIAMVNFVLGLLMSPQQNTVVFLSHLIGNLNLKVWNYRRENNDIQSKISKLFDTSSPIIGQSWFHSKANICYIISSSSVSFPHYLLIQWITNSISLYPHLVFSVGGDTLSQRNWKIKASPSTITKKICGFPGSLEQCLCSKSWFLIIHLPWQRNDVCYFYEVHSTSERIPFFITTTGQGLIIFPIKECILQPKMN